MLLHLLLNFGSLQVLLAAAKHVEDRVDAVDLNLGCPQRVAHAEHFGSYLLDEKDRPLLCSIVKRFLDLFKVAVCCCVCYCSFSL